MNRPRRGAAVGSQRTGCRPGREQIFERFYRADPARRSLDFRSAWRRALARHALQRLNTGR